MKNDAIISLNNSDKVYFCPFAQNGRMAERLGTGLQNPLHRFESGSDLKENPPHSGGFFCL